MITFVITIQKTFNLFCFNLQAFQSKNVQIYFGKRNIAWISMLKLADYNRVERIYLIEIVFSIKYIFMNIHYYNFNLNYLLYLNVKITIIFIISLLLFIYFLLNLGRWCDIDSSWKVCYRKKEIVKKFTAEVLFRC